MTLCFRNTSKMCLFHPGPTGEVSLPLAFLSLTPSRHEGLFNFKVASHLVMGDMNRSSILFGTNWSRSDMNNTIGWGIGIG